jgi:hypothetical protein
MQCLYLKGDTALVKFNVKESVLAGQRHELAVSIQIHAIACSNSVFLFAKLDRDQTVRAPGYDLVHVDFIVLQPRVSLAQRMFEINLRMNGQVNGPPLGRLAEAVQLVTLAAEVVAKQGALERPLSVHVRLQIELALVVRARLLTAHLAVLVRAQVAAERAHQIHKLVRVLFERPLLLLAQRVARGVYLVAEVLGREIFRLHIHEAHVPFGIWQNATTAASRAGRRMGGGRVDEMIEILLHRVTAVATERAAVAAATATARHNVAIGRRGHGRMGVMLLQVVMKQSARCSSCHTCAHVYHISPIAEFR